MNAYSHLKRLLKQRRMSIPELHRRMRTQGLFVNVKSLYRLSQDNRPVDRLDMHVAGAICQVCAVPLSDWIVFDQERGTLRTLDEKRQIQLDGLMAKNSAGTLLEAEQETLRELVRAAEEITLANARLLAQQQKRLESETLPVNRAT